MLGYVWGHFVWEMIRGQLHPPFRLFHSMDILYTLEIQPILPQPIRDTIPNLTYGMLAKRKPLALCSLSHKHTLAPGKPVL